MTAMILDGKKLAQTMQAELADEVARFTRTTGVRPGLAAVLVGENHPGRLYVRNKRKACEAVGMESTLLEFPSTVTQDEMMAAVARLNLADEVHGILIQMPLPKHLDEDELIESVAPLKDVDGFGPASLGLLAVGRPRFLACTPYGVMQILSRHGIEVASKSTARTTRTGRKTRSTSTGTT
jgi:methylenetetrahydrofolate dehydrogenase (NADP+) / methenyltetrahydrofolate cyclohydrolase